MRTNWVLFAWTALLIAAATVVGVVFVLMVGLGDRDPSPGPVVAPACRVAPR